MSEKTIITRDKYSIFQLLAMLWVIFMAIFVDLDFSEPAIPIGSILILIILFYFSLWSVQIVISENAISKGEKFLFIKERKKVQTVPWSDYQGLRIEQNESKHFEIKATSSNNDGFVIDFLPNKKPAEERLKAIELEINKAFGK